LVTAELQLPAGLDDGLGGTEQRDLQRRAVADSKLAAGDYHRRIRRVPHEHAANERTTIRVYNNVVNNNNDNNNVFGFTPLSGRSQHDRASLTIVHGHRARVVHQVHARVPAVAHDELLASDRAGRFARHTTVQVFDHVVRGVQVFAFHPAHGRPATAVNIE